MPNDLIDPVEVRKEMDVMIEMITHPAFVDAMKDMKATPVSKRRELGKKTLTVDALRRKGVKIPDKMRLTTRYFEPGKPGILEIRPTGNPVITKFPRYPQIDALDPGTVAWGGCACGGGLTFCGGAGGST